MTESPLPPDDLSDAADFQRALGDVIESAVDNDIDIIGGWTVARDSMPKSFDVEIIRYASDN